MTSKTYEIWWDPKYESEVLICAEDPHEGKFRDLWEKRHEFQAADWEAAKVIRNHLMGFEPYQPEYERYQPKLERTGRTTRMLADAVQARQEGRAVYVIGADSKHVNILRGMTLEQFGVDESERIKFETAETMGNWDWELMRGSGMWPNCEVFVDH